MRTTTTRSHRLARARSRRAALAAAALGAAALAGSAAAHHSRFATYDPDKAVSLSGTVTKLEWRNPHIWVYFDVKDAKGGVVGWACEGGAPNALYRRGWRPDSLKSGDTINLEGEVARNGSPNCNIRSVTLGDGTKVFAGDATTPETPSAAAPPASTR
jgi:hypothetical protein